MNQDRSTLLYIEASPRKTSSSSIAAAEGFLDAISRHCPGAEIDRLSLWQTTLPEFDGATISAKYATLAGRQFSAPEAAAWQEIARMVERLKAAWCVVIATPMWNFGIPYKLKHWIDLITQPGLTFSFSAETGYAPLLKPRPVLVILSSSGDYTTGASRGRPDLATPYLREALKFIGLSDVTFVPIGPTIGPEALLVAARAKAHARLLELAASLGRLS